MKEKQDIIKIAVKILIFLAIGIFLYSPFHEVVHAIAVKIIGHNLVFNGSLIRPVISCFDCQTASLPQLIFINIAPYLVSIFILFMTLFTAKKIIHYISHLALFDIFTNFIGMILVAFNVIMSNDFINLIKAGRLELVLVILVLWSIFLSRSMQLHSKTLLKSFKKLLFSSKGKNDRKTSL